MSAIWEAAKTAIKAHVPAHSYRMWIEPLELKDFEQGICVLSCPNPFSKKRVQCFYHSIIESEINRVSGSECKLSLEVSGTGRCVGKKRKPTTCTFDTKSLATGKDLQMDLPRLNRPSGGHMLHKDFTFENFVVGRNSDFAYSAALSLASRKRSDQHSLFLLSKTGMGKTHLSQAMGHHILSQYPSERVYYITAEDFASEMIYAFKNKSIEKFKERYRQQCDVLLLEDVHFLTGKDRTQSELAFVLDHMLESARKVIFTSCYLPADIPKLNEQLKSRLSSGLITNIDAPDFRTRVRILRKKALCNRYNIPAEVVDYLAGELTENVRQLESGLLGVAKRAALMGEPIGLDLAEDVVDLIARQKKRITVDVIKNLVSKEYNVTIKDLVSSSRRKSVVLPRQVAIFLSRRYTDQPLQAIGRNFNRIHATAIHAINAIESELKANSPVGKQVKYLDKKLSTGDY